MDEIKALLKNWEDNNYINPDGLVAAHQAITILLEKVELLEKQIADLQSLQEG
jgi:hypothetical protein